MGGPKARGTVVEPGTFVMWNCEGPERLWNFCWLEHIKCGTFMRNLGEREPL